MKMNGFMSTRILEQGVELTILVKLKPSTKLVGRTIGQEIERGYTVLRNVVFRICFLSILLILAFSQQKTKK